VNSRSWFFALRLGVLLAVLLICSAPPASADRGVGVTSSSIEVLQGLKPGGAYAVATLGVINTGSEPCEYELVVSHLDGQPERRPDAGWFDLAPSRFHLEPGASRNIEVKLTLPTGADAGDYFALLEARPVESGSGVTVGVAVATKVTFTVEPASWWSAQVTRLIRWLDDASPWSYIVAGLAALAILIARLGPKYRLRLPVERRR